jgi:diguanylate cyclase (GGDEF)-like protein/putative nucleotidyltransferase with HDIG domain
MNLNISKNHLPATSFLILLGLVSSSIIGWAILSVVSLSTASMLSLAGAAVVSAFVARFQVRLRGASDVLPVANIFAIWGMSWYGLPAGIILGAVTVAFNFWPSRHSDKEGIFSISSGLVSMAVSAAATSLVLGRLLATDYQVSNFGLGGLKILLLSPILFAVVYLALNVTLFVIYHMLKGDSQTPQATRARVFQQSTAGLIVAAGTVAVCLPFLYFGLGFGLVCAPAVIFANLAYSIHLKRLEQKTREITEASRVHVATVEALATAIDARDQIGLGHVRRTQIYAIGIGELLGLADDEISALRTGALLHDIGKLAVPDHILSKPGKLTPAELEKAKIHAAVGASILEKVDFKYPVVLAVKHHHERWDGLGYPDGLKGEDIPLTARILAVADAYDTLRGARPYRPAHPRERARQIVSEGSGNRFDPTVIRYFLKNLARLEADIDAQGLSYSLDDQPNASNALGNGGYVEQIKLANREVFTLYELAREFSSSFELHETLALFTKKVGEFVPFVTCAVYLIDEKKGFATAVHVDGENKSILTSRRIKVGQGATGIALKRKETVHNVDPDLDFAFSHVELAQQYSAMAAVPLIADDVLIGAVSIYSRNMESYGEEHLRLFETIARIAAEAIGKSMQHNEVKAHALTDPMTGLPNARCLQIQFEKEVGRASRSGSCFQLLMLDLDGFKVVNDSFGHKVGDDILREVGKVIRGQLRDYDFLARYGGDEFVALIPDTSQPDVLDLCRRIEKAVGEFKLPLDGGKYASVGVSPGSAGFPAQGETFNQMIVSADKAMYERKTRRKLVNPIPDRDTVLRPQPQMVQHPTPQPITERETTPENDSFIVELDESHVVSNAVN